MRCTILRSMFGLAAAAGLASAQPFTPTNLGTLGGSFSRGYAINASGTAVGFSHNTSAPFANAFSWTSSGGIAPLPVSGVGTGSFIRPDSAYAINSGGMIVGIGNTGAFALSGGTLTSLGTLSPLLTSVAWGVNVHGDVVGECYDPNAILTSRGFVHRAGVMSLAGPLRDARDINDSGIVIGTGGSVDRAMLWDSTNGMSTNLGTLGGSVSTGRAVNNAGVAVGFSSTPTGATHAFMWSAAAGMVNISAPYGAAGGFATDINTAGDIVGWIGLVGTRRAAYWTNGVPVDLNTLLPSNSDWVLDEAWGINDAGCIVGTGHYLGDERAFVVCIPAPGTLLTLAGSGLLAVRRRRR